MRAQPYIGLSKIRGEAIFQEEGTGKIGNWVTVMRIKCKEAASDPAMIQLCTI